MSLNLTLEKMREHITLGEYHNAYKIGMLLYSKNSTSVPLNKGLAIASNFMGNLTKAYEFFEQAYINAPDDPDVLYNIATISLNLGWLGKAEHFFNLLLANEIKNPEVYQNYINVLFRRKKTEEGFFYSEEALSLFPQHEGISLTYGSALEEANQLEKAEKLISKLPDSSIKDIVLARLLFRNKEYDQAESKLRYVNVDSLDVATRQEYFNLLGLILDKCKKHLEAFEAFNLSNKAALDMDYAKQISKDQYIQELILLSELYKQPAIFSTTNYNEETPAFFVGFPRSGTTLMEQMLKAHKDIITTDERSPFEYVLNEEKSFKTLSQLYLDWQNKDLSSLRTRFWEVVKEFGLEYKKGKMLVDKLPLNIVMVPFIKMLFPKAPILIAYRDPRDCCLSAFMQKFRLSNAMINFTEWHKTAKTYDLVMSTWEQAQQASNQ